MTQPEKIEYILQKSCEYFGVSREIFMDKSEGKTGRTGGWVSKRYIIYAFNKYTICNSTQIAKLLGFRQPGNVIFHLKNIKEELSKSLYGFEKTKMVMKEYLEYLNL
jgi:hypothetical protein